MELIYEDFQVISFAELGDEEISYPFNVELEITYSRVGTLNVVEVSVIISSIVLWIIFYVLSFLHCAKTVDLFKPCRRKPITEEQLARINYAKEVNMCLERIKPAEENEWDPKLRKLTVRNQRSPRTKERELEAELVKR